MAEHDQAQWIVPTTGAKTLPVIEILTGRGFITGKSGSGKSNTASVIAEGLLENNYNLLIIDPEGEYYGLKEQYEILHVGNDDLCDVQVTADHADQLAEIALERNMPVILDVSDFLDASVAEELIAGTVRALFRREKDARKPFLVMIEEMQEYLPQQGGNNELAELLERVAKRGRKRGLGMLGMSQRPSSVDKDFITQCDWMVWHRLTWQNDIKVVRNVLGSDIADEVEDLDTGEGYLMTDWDESVERVQFKKKETHDAGATPGLESYERPDLKSVSEDLVRDLTKPEPEATDDSSSGTDGEAIDLDAAVDSANSDGDGNATTASGTGPADDAEVLSASSIVGEEGPPTVDEAGMDVPEQGADPDGPVQDVVDETIETDVEALDETELRQAVQSLQQRNRVLEDEVAELRTILQNVDTASADAAGSETAAAELESPPEFAGSKPVPPAPPAPRSGIAGNLIEFVYMVVYLLKVLRYRAKSKFHELRYGKRANAN